MEESKKVVFGTASIFDLKAELHKKKEALKQAKLEREYGISAKVQHKKPSIWNKQNKGVHERAHKDVEEIKDDDNDEFKRSRAALEKKAELYDRLTKGDKIPEDEENELYLVNFQKKVIDSILHEKKEKETSTHLVQEEKDNSVPCDPDEEWVDYTDSLGRSRCCLRKDLPELMKMDKNLNHSPKNDIEMVKVELKTEEERRRKLQREQWEKEEEEARNKPIGPVHYQNVLYKEIRNHGIGYFAFSTSEEERSKQMTTLSNLREQTSKQRDIREKLKQKRKAMLEERLAKVRQRKNLKLEENQDEPADVQECSASEEIKDSDPLPQLEVPPKPSKIRPWDIGKDLNQGVNINQDLKQRLSERDWITQRREERLEEFAPPSMYFESKARGTKKQPNRIKQNWQKHEALSSCDVNVSSIPLPGPSVSDSLQPENLTKDQNDSILQTKEEVEKMISETLAYFRAQSNYSNK